MTRGISLANKCLILFGCALAVILILTLAVPWFATSGLVRDYQREVASQLVDSYLHDPIDNTARTRSLEDLVAWKLNAPAQPSDPILKMFYIPWSSITRVPSAGDGAGSASVPTETREVQQYARVYREAFGGPDPKEDISETETLHGQTVFVYAHRYPDAGTTRLAGRDAQSATPRQPDGVIVVFRSTNFGEDQLGSTRVLILVAGLVAIIVSMLVFRVMLARLIFTPVKRLKSVIEQVTEGNIEARSKLQTGDELEALSGGLDEMLDQVTETQDRLQRMNESLDLKVAELAEANVGLWESTRFKTEFLANISHELRTPLNSIIGFTELLHDKAMEEDEPGSRRVRYLTNILNSSNSLLEMINELLDMAKIEAGRMEVNVEPTSLGDVIEGLVRIMGPQAAARDITINAEIPEDLPVIETDPGKVQQILYNLLSNAVKFSPANGTITLSAETRTPAEAGGPTRVVLSVADEGPGIPADMHDVIFEKFRQVDASHTRTHMGTGLGLAICRDLVDMLHGELWLQSADGEGTTFFVSLDVVFRTLAPQALMGDQ
ncbi:MAG: HAMP domain-containing histidine kinase [Phycisphaerales bacterium]|nr:HAMP domain-containing histidine kinase [Phycisphaerales bacterium]